MVLKNLHPGGVNGFEKISSEGVKRSENRHTADDHCGLP
jgi:hypothetical protein